MLSKKEPTLKKNLLSICGLLFERTLITRNMDPSLSLFTSKRRAEIGLAHHPFCYIYNWSFPWHKNSRFCSNMISMMFKLFDDFESVLLSSHKNSIKKCRPVLIHSKTFHFQKGSGKLWGQNI